MRTPTCKPASQARRKGREVHKLTARSNLVWSQVPGPCCQKPVTSLVCQAWKDTEELW